MRTMINIVPIWNSYYHLHIDDCIVIAILSIPSIQIHTGIIHLCISNLHILVKIDGMDVNLLYLAVGNELMLCNNLMQIDILTSMSLNYIVYHFIYLYILSFI